MENLKGRTMKVAVVFQMVFGLIGISLSIYEISTKSSLVSSTLAFTSTKLFTDILTTSQEYYMLGIHISYILIAFIGYPGYKYRKSLLISFHAFTTAILSICIFTYFIYFIIDGATYYLKYLMSPIAGILISCLGMRDLHSKLTGFKDDNYEVPDGSFLSGECSNCGGHALLLSTYLCGHKGVCEQCAVSIKECPICQSDSYKLY